MLDLVEGAKIINGMTPSTASNTNSDWINCENMHRVWAICQRSEAKGSTNVFIGQVAESYAGASASNAGCVYWGSTILTTFDRITKSTQSTGLDSGSSKGMVIMMHDPATADTSDKYFSVNVTSGWGCSVVYICEPRYGGLAQFIATTSST